MIQRITSALFIAVLAAVPASGVLAQASNPDAQLNACVAQCNKAWDECMSHCTIDDDACMRQCDAESDVCSKPCVARSQKEFEEGVPAGK